MSERLKTGRGSVDTTSCVDKTPGREKTYTLRVRQRTEVRISTTASGSDRTEFDPVLTLLENCNSGEESACSDPRVSKARSFNGLIQTVLSPGRYRLRIDTRNTSSGGRYTIRTESINLDTNATCSNARVLSPGATLRFNPSDTSGYGRRSPCFGVTENARFYEVDVPANSSLSVKAEYTGIGASGGPKVGVGDTCSRSSCELAEKASGDVGLGLSNTSNSTKTYKIVVANKKRRRYEIETKINQTASNAQCKNAKRLPRSGNNYANAENGKYNAKTCDGDRAYKLFYKYTVDSKSRLFLADLQGITGPVAADLRQSCSASSCLDRPYTNNTSQSQTVIVETTGSTPRFAQQINPLEFKLADYSKCSQAKSISLNNTPIDEDIRTGGEPFNACGIDLSNGDHFTLFYRLVVPRSGSDLIVRAKPRDRQNLSQNTSISLQAVKATSNVCQTKPSQLSCIVSDDGAQRSTPTAEINVSQGLSSSPGSGPVSVLLAVTMDPKLNSGAFELSLSL